MHHLLEVWFGWVQNWGYVGIILLMAMESSIFPVPSELVIPPAAFLAAEGKLNIYGVVAAGTIWEGGRGGALAIGGDSAGWAGAGFVRPGLFCLETLI